MAREKHSCRAGGGETAFEGGDGYEPPRVLPSRAYGRGPRASLELGHINKADAILATSCDRLMSASIHVSVYARAGACVSWSSAMDTWQDKDLAARLAACEVRQREREAEREGGRRAIEAKRGEESARLSRDAEERKRLREARDKPCGAKTRAGHPCQRKGRGRGGRCPNHGGMSTGPRTEAGRQRLADAARARWAAWRAARLMPS